MAAGHGDNARLRALVKEARWTGDDLARAVNAMGAETGLVLRYRRPSVAQWMAGAMPRGQAAELVVEALSRRLGRPVTLSEAGFDAAGRLDNVAPLDVAALLRSLSQNASRSGELLPVYSLEAIDPTSGLSGRLRIINGECDDAPPRLSATHVGAVDTMTMLAGAADQAFGAGVTRPAIADYLATTVGPWLRLPSRPSVRRQLLTAAANLTYLCGFINFDDDMNGAAQCYYRLSVALSDEAGDLRGRAIALRALSAQARILGHHSQALQLAEASVEHSGSFNAETRAFLHGQLSVAHAAMGDRFSAVKHVRSAETYLSRALSIHVPVPVTGIYNEASLAHQTAALLYYEGNEGAAVRSLQNSLRLRPTREMRAKAITLARLAELQMAQGELEAACATWSRFVLTRTSVRSRRTDRAIAVMKSHLAPYQRHSAVRALLEGLPRDP